MQSQHLQNGTGLLSFTRIQTHPNHSIKPQQKPTTTDDTQLDKTGNISKSPNRGNNKRCSSLRPEASWRKVHDLARLETRRNFAKAYNTNRHLDIHLQGQPHRETAVRYPAHTRHLPNRAREPRAPCSDQPPRRRKPRVRHHNQTPDTSPQPGLLHVKHPPCSILLPRRSWRTLFWCRKHDTRRRARMDIR